MGNSPSTQKPSSSGSASASNSASHSPASYESSKTPSSRRDHPRHLLQSQRTAAAAEPSLTHRGTSATHRARASQSSPVAHLIQSSPTQPLNHTFSSNNSQPGTPQHIHAGADPRGAPSKPVDVPVPSSTADSSTSRSYSRSIDPSGLSGIPDMSYQYSTRPPRLPLPIEEEVHTPGSPIIHPADIDAPILDLDDEDGLSRHGSQLSNTTLDEDEDEAPELNVATKKASVPTAFEWRRGGEKVYVTGTIFQWNKKHRLHPVDGQPNLLRAIIPVKPGTHHVRFIIDSLMQCSPDLPTTVDFGNNLVNYIEVSADDLPQDDHIPVEEAEARAPDHEPIVSHDAARRDHGDVEEMIVKPQPKTRHALPLDDYIAHVPQYLVDLDKAEESREYRYAARAIEKLPSPPSLPGFMGKPILNAATPMKDDNSVLTMPNHTVLNHLATSSIKQNVLAVSGTTRYKKKFVTTIMYKPTAADH